MVWRWLHDGLPMIFVSIIAGPPQIPPAGGGAERLLQRERYCNLPETLIDALLPIEMNFLKVMYYMALGHIKLI